MRQKTLSLLLFVTVFFFMLLCQPADSADPAKDPKGWKNLKFGMSPSEVLMALGDDGYVEQKKQEVAPKIVNADPELSLNQIRDKAKKLLVVENDEIVISACRKFLRDARTITWKPHPVEGSSFWYESFGRLRSTRGVLESFHDGMCTMKVGSRVANLPLNELDDSTREKVEQIVQLAKEIDGIKVEGHGEPVEKDETQEKIHQEAVTAENLRSKSVVIRGITLTPTFSFDNNKLIEISMYNSYAGEEGQLFDHRGKQMTLVQGLVDKYGEYDERNSGNKLEFIWRFPETVIRCMSYQSTFAGTRFVRKGYSLAYEKPTVTNASGSDNL